MSDINGQSFTVTKSKPTVIHTITYDKTRINNSTMRYEVTIRTNLKWNSDFIHNNYGLNCIVRIGDGEASGVVKYTSSNWNGTGDHWTTVTVDCSSYDDSDKDIYISIYGVNGLQAGTIDISGYTVGASRLNITDCSAPTWMSASPETFEDNVYLSWGGAEAGVDNSIEEYKLVYQIWDGSWSNDIFLDYTSNESYSVNMSSIPRGNYVRFFVKAIGSVEGYDSGWKMSNEIQRIAYTYCSSPNDLRIKNTDGVTLYDYDDNITITWSGAKDGTQNSIIGYVLCLRIDGINYSLNGTPNSYTTIALTSSYGEYKANFNWVKRGTVGKLWIYTKGSAGSSYDSSWYGSNQNIRRFPYGYCTQPTTLLAYSENALNNKIYTEIFNNSIELRWAGAKNGENNAIKYYQISYQISEDNLNWSNWNNIDNINQSPYIIDKLQLDKLNINRGNYIRFRIRAIGEQRARNSDWKILDNDKTKRNKLPLSIQNINVTPKSCDFSFGDNVNIAWDLPTDKDTVYRYDVSMTIGNANDVSQNILNGILLPWTELSPITNINNTQYNFNKETNKYYVQIENSITPTHNSLVQFNITVVDVFGEKSIKIYTPIINRYDITGISIGHNGKWVNCQLFYHGQLEEKLMPVATTSDDWVYYQNECTTKQYIKIRNQNNELLATYLSLEPLRLYITYYDSKYNIVHTTNYRDIFPNKVSYFDNIKETKNAVYAKITISFQSKPFEVININGFDLLNNEWLDTITQVGLKDLQGVLQWRDIETGHSK